MMAVNNEISKAFNQHAAEYELAAKVQREIGQRLFERLDYLKITPKRILDLGCGTGFFSRELAIRFPKAEIFGLDLAPAMLQEAKKKQSWFRKWPLIAADMRYLPFATGLFDLVFANQVIHWADALPPIFRELNRVMNVHACLMFTTLGPDTFKEIKQAWASVDDYAHVNTFVDMHDVGDDLLAEHFLDPVMDMEWLSMHYQSMHDLLKSLKMQGVRNINAARKTGLTGRKAWEQFERNYAELKTAQGKYPLTYEVVYGHAWKGEQRKTDKGVETFIPVAQIVKRTIE